MTAIKGLGTSGNGAGVVTPLDMKIAQSGLMAKTALNAVRPGLFWGGTPTIVGGTAGMAYSVIAYTCATSRGATAGTVLGGNDGTIASLATTAAPGSNSRYDVVYHWPREYSIDGVDSNPVIGVIQGTSAASPTVPSLAAFPGAIELARILVPTGVTATNSGTTITQTAPFTATAGGVVAVRTTTDRAAGSWVESQRVWDIATDVTWSYDGSGWYPATSGALTCRVVRSTATPTVSNAAYTDLSTTANWLTTGPAAQNVGFAAYSNGITIPVSGVYDVGYSLLSVANIALVLGLTINDAAAITGDLKLSVTVGQVQSVVSGAAAGEMYLAAGDVVRLWALAASGAPAMSASQGHFYATWVRA